jgi:formylglycine-generating enzyme required for sulfatase activity
VLIPGATFGMGCPSRGDPRCGNHYRPISVASFYLDVFEVAYQDFQRCVAAGACSPLPGECRLINARPNAPAQCLSWYNAKAYCEWRGKRLPTSAEWELAARGPDGGHDYPWGDQWRDDWANWCDGRGCDGSVDGYAGAAPVDAFPQNVSPYGVRNLAGNMVEWTATARPERSADLRVARRLLSPQQRHGTPERRIAVLARKLGSRRPQCRSHGARAAQSLFDGSANIRTLRCRALGSSMDIPVLGKVPAPFLSPKQENGLFSRSLSRSAVAPTAGGIRHAWCPRP